MKKSTNEYFPYNIKSIKMARNLVVYRFQGAWEIDTIYPKNVYSFSIRLLQCTLYT